MADPIVVHIVPVSQDDLDRDTYNAFIYNEFLLGPTDTPYIDTAQALQMREACDVILVDLDGLSNAVRDRALEHRRTSMIGRTHGVHAEPITFGLKLALWYAQIGRDIERIRRARATINVGKLSGAVGTFAHLAPEIEGDVCRRLGLEPAAVASQVIQRDRHAELLCALSIAGSARSWAAVGASIEPRVPVGLPRYS